MLSRLCRPVQRALKVLGSAGPALVCTREAVVQFLCPLPSLLAVGHRPTSAFANREVDGKHKQLRKRCATEKDALGGTGRCPRRCRHGHSLEADSQREEQVGRRRCGWAAGPPEQPKLTRGVGVEPTITF
jgi:hypothetical protein